MRETIKFAFKSQQFVMQKKLYDHIAIQFQTTPIKVDRAIRSAIKAAWQRRNTYTFEKYFGSKQNKPTPREFIARLVDYLKLKYELS